jgi:hypothetical protein
VEATREEVLAWYRENAVPAELQPITDVRANVVARLRGAGGGPTVLFNAHLDTEASGPEYDRLMAVPEAQTRLAFENIGRALLAAGATWGDGELLVQVAGLVRPGALIEIEAFAVI